MLSLWQNHRGWCFMLGSFALLSNDESTINGFMLYGAKFSDFKISYSSFSKMQQMYHYVVRKV